MKALVYTGDKTLDYKVVPEPNRKKEDVLIKIDSVGICGSDIHAFLGHDERRPPPLILGHEASGFIVEGENVGQRVTINPLVSCGTCWACKKGKTNLCSNRELISIPPRDGAFAEYLAVPYENVLKVPDSVNIRNAALTEPLACGWHAVKLGMLSLDTELSKSKCLVVGGGAIGVGVSLALKAHGVSNRTILEKNPIRQKSLRQNFSGDTEIIASIEGFAEYDFVIDAVGYPMTRQISSEFCRPGGVIAHIGLGNGAGGLDIRRMTLQEITFFGTYAFTKQDFLETAEAIFLGKMGDFEWVEERAIKDGERAFQDICDSKVSASKILLRV
ncbi:MAG: alcohol dehydrogenase catalytic domain-containing protein [Pseudomonadota bacterium]|nr:alcohol dehydrogenase catalytic domain-containing protein [Pseudomonadota bacterium]